MKCSFMLWPGSGYCLDGPFTVESDLLDKNDLECALELLAAYLIKHKLTNYYLTLQEYDDLCRSIGYDPDDPDDLDGWCYVDGTTEGAPYPVYIGTENLRFEFSN